jgi:methionine-rich copper-binding protein CopC
MEIKMMRSARSVAGLLAALATAAAGQAQAHAHLTSAQPAENVSGPAPKQLVLHFSEKLVTKFSGFDLAKADGAKVPLKASPGKDGMTLTGAPVKPLTPGLYNVTWHAVTADTHRMEGAYSFTVH